VTYNPATLHDLGVFWTSQGGVNLGVVGDTSHVAKGTSYHLGKSQLVSTAYSIQTARDKAGLTEAASAIDLGKLDGSLVELRTFSKWLVAQARSNAPGTSDIREIIYSPDGKTVLRWDRQRGYASAPRPGEADDTHLFHDHVSWYRDAEHRDHTTAFRPYFETGADVPTPSSYIPGYTATIKATANIRSAPSLTATVYRVTTGETWNVTCWEKGQVDPADGSDQWLCAWSNASKRWEYTAHSNVTSTNPSGGDCSAEVKAATAPLNAQIAQLRTDVTNATLAGAQAEWDRQSTAATVAVELAPRP
jgi:hypothetical protein